MSDQRIYRLRVAIALVGRERTADADLHIDNACPGLLFHNTFCFVSCSPDRSGADQGNTDRGARRRVGPIEDHRKLNSTVE